MSERDEFERHRNCCHCGQRLIHAQYEDGGATMFTKRCPQFDPLAVGNRHDFLEHRHAYPYRDRRGRVSEGTKRSVGVAPEPPE